MNIAEADWETVVMPVKPTKSVKRSVGESFYSEMQDTQVDVLHQDASVHQPSALSDLLDGSTSMDVDVDSVGVRTKFLHESTTGDP